MDSEIETHGRSDEYRWKIKPKKTHQPNFKKNRRSVAKVKTEMVLTYTRSFWWWSILFAVLPEASGSTLKRHHIQCRQKCRFWIKDWTSNTVQNVLFRVYLGSQYGKQLIFSSKIRGYIREKIANKDCISNKLHLQDCQEFERENPKRGMFYEIDTELTYLEKVTIRKLTSNYQSFEIIFYLCSIMSLYIVILLLLLHINLIL